MIRPRSSGSASERPTRFSRSRFSRLSSAQVHPLLQRVVIRLANICDARSSSSSKAAKQSAFRSVLLRRLESAQLAREVADRSWRDGCDWRRSTARRGRSRRPRFDSRWETGSSPTPPSTRSISVRPMSAFGSKRVIATLTRSGPQRCRRWLTMRVALRSAGSSWFATTTTCDDRVERLEHGRFGPGAIEHDEWIHRRGQLEQPANAGHIERNRW